MDTTTTGRGRGRGGRGEAAVSAPGSRVFRHLLVAVSLGLLALPAALPRDADAEAEIALPREAEAEAEFVRPARAHVTPDQLALASQRSAGRADEIAAPHSVDSRPPVDADRFGSLHGNVAFDYDSLPGRLGEARLRSLWNEGSEFERKEALLESARVYEVIVSEVPDEAFTYWRLARNYWRYGESLPHTAKEERVRYFELAENWAGRGLSIDPDCAPCMLWKFVSMGRQATTKGLLTAVGDVREMERLLKRGIELRPQHADDEGNRTLGNLYYAGAVFYRVIPDWFWLRWFIGIRGDKERAIEYARNAVQLAQVRVDYRVELGAALLCYGTEKKHPEAIEEGVAILEEARKLDFYLSTDYLDREHAGILIESPEKACGYSRDGFIDMNQVLSDSKKKH